MYERACFYGSAMPITKGADPSASNFFSIPLFIYAYTVSRDITLSKHTIRSTTVPDAIGRGGA